MRHSCTYNLALAGNDICNGHSLCVTRPCISVQTLGFSSLRCLQASMPVWLRISRTCDHRNALRICTRHIEPSSLSFHSRRFENLSCEFARSIKRNARTCPSFCLSLLTEQKLETACCCDQLDICTCSNSADQILLVHTTSTCEQHGDLHDDCVMKPHKKNDVGFGAARAWNCNHSQVYQNQCRARSWAICLRGSGARRDKRPWVSLLSLWLGDGTASCAVSRLQLRRHPSTPPCSDGFIRRQEIGLPLRRGLILGDVEVETASNHPTERKVVDVLGEVESWPPAQQAHNQTNMCRMAHQRTRPAMMAFVLTGSETEHHNLSLRKKLNTVRITLSSALGNCKRQLHLHTCQSRTCSKHFVEFGKAVALDTQDQMLPCGGLKPNWKLLRPSQLSAFTFATSNLPCVLSCTKTKRHFRHGVIVRTPSLLMSICFNAPKLREKLPDACVPLTIAEHTDDHSHGRNNVLENEKPSVGSTLKGTSSKSVLHCSRHGTMLTYIKK